MNQSAFDAIEQVWTVTVKSRALCPYVDKSAVGIKGYHSPPWYRAHGAYYFVNLAKPLTERDVNELIEIGSFINRSFIISMFAILEAHGVVPYRVEPDRTKPGGDHVQLTKWLRNRFAHGEWEYDASNQDHVETRDLLAKLFPCAGEGEPRFVVSIDSVLEPLKNGVLEYIQATT
ncbi:MAG: hypothetical protein ACXACY_26200 [Candidatus Hodarchaeales archaeon]|jgi:hypothetical protein